VLVVNGAVRMPCRDVCGSDIGRLYQDRGIDRHHAPLFDRDLEYPPVIGLVMYAAVLPFDRGLRGPFLVNATLLIALAALTTWMLWRRYGRAARRWALAPPLLVNGALTNWDLLAVAPATVALLRFDTGDAFLPGLLLGVGAAAKLCPALYVPILAAAAAVGSGWSRARRLLLGAVVGAGVFAVPVYAVAPDALTHFLDFHRVRTPSRGAIWFYVFRTPAMNPWLPAHDVASVMNAVTIAVVLAALVALVVWTARRRISPIAACALVTIVFVLANKIYSPQYDVWVVPFLVMLPVRTRLVVHYYAGSLVSFVLIAGARTVFGAGALHLYVILAAVMYRFVALLLIGAEVWRSSTHAGRTAEALDPHELPTGRAAERRLVDDAGADMRAR
jgi:Glycosyltransferase family 87